MRPLNYYIERHRKLIEDAGYTELEKGIFEKEYANGTTRYIEFTIHKLGKGKREIWLTTGKRKSDGRIIHSQPFCFRQALLNAIYPPIPYEAVKSLFMEI